MQINLQVNFILCTFTSHPSTSWLKQKRKMKDDFQPFELTIEVDSLRKLEALWLMANSDTFMAEFLNSHPQKQEYVGDHELPTPIGIHWSELSRELQKYNDKIS